MQQTQNSVHCLGDFCAQYFCVFVTARTTTRFQHDRRNLFTNYKMVRGEFKTEVRYFKAQHWDFSCTGKSFHISWCRATQISGCVEFCKMQKTWHTEAQFLLSLMGRNLMPTSACRFLGTRNMISRFLWISQNSAKIRQQITTRNQKPPSMKIDETQCVGSLQEATTITWVPSASIEDATILQNSNFGF